MPVQMHTANIHKSHSILEQEKQHPLSGEFLSRGGSGAGTGALIEDERQNTSYSFHPNAPMRQADNRRPDHSQSIQRSDANRSPIIVNLEVAKEYMMRQNPSGSIHETARTITNYLDPTSDKHKVLLGSSNNQHHIPSLSSGQFLQEQDNLLNSDIISQSHLQLAQQVFANENIARTGTNDSISFLQYVAADSSRRQTVTSKNESAPKRHPSNTYAPPNVKGFIHIERVEESSQEVSKNEEMLIK